MTDKIETTTESAGPLLAPGLSEFSRLPRAREREPITGSSRGWLLDFDRELPPAEKFIVRAKRRGRARGVCFIDTGKLLAALRRMSAAEAATK